MCRKNWLALAAALQCAAAFALDIKPESLTPELISGSTWVPVSAYACRLRTPDGSEAYFMRAEDDKRTFVGDWPWVATGAFGATTLLRADRDYKTWSGRTYKGREVGVAYRAGLPVRFVLGDVKKDVTDAKPPKRTLAELWPDGFSEAEKKYRDERSDIWRTGSRLRFIWRDPNLSAILLMQLALLGLAVAAYGLSAGSRAAKAACIAGGLAFSAAGLVMLMLTQSRGAFLGFLVGGAAIVLAAARSLFTVRRLLAVLVLLGVFAAALYATGASDRFTKSLVKLDDSTSYRVAVWSAAPKMMVDAPSGWGCGNSGASYMRWYQDFSGSILHGHSLFSSHLTAMVEHGWAFRLAYIAFWLFALCGLVRLLVCRKASWPLAVVAGTGVATAFVTAASPLLWTVPVVALMYAAAKLGRSVLRMWPYAVGALAIAGAALFGIHSAGANADGMEVHGSSTQVVVNGEKPDVWIVDDGWSLDAGRFGGVGKELRSALRSVPLSPCVGYVESVADLPGDAAKVVLVGKRVADFMESLGRFTSLKSVVFISPSISVKEVPAAFKDGKTDFHAYVGRHAVSDAESSDWLTVVEGTELYIPGWPLALLKR